MGAGYVRRRRRSPSAENQKLSILTERECRTVDYSINGKQPDNNGLVRYGRILLDVVIVSTYADERFIIEKPIGSAP